MTINAHSSKTLNPLDSFKTLQEFWSKNINGIHVLRIQYREEFCEHVHSHQKFNDLKEDKRMRDPSKYSQYIEFPFATEQEWIDAGSLMPNLSCQMATAEYSI